MDTVGLSDVSQVPPEQETIYCARSEGFAWLQEATAEHAETRQAAMDEAFKTDSSDEDEFGEAMPMLKRRNSAALNAKLSFEEPGQCGLQVIVITSG